MVVSKRGLLELTFSDRERGGGGSRRFPVVREPNQKLTSARNSQVEGSGGRKWLGCIFHVFCVCGCIYHSFFPFRLRALVRYRGWYDDELSLSFALIVAAHHDESSSIPRSNMSPSAWNSTVDFGSQKCPPKWRRRRRPFPCSCPSKISGQSPNQAVDYVV